MKPKRLPKHVFYSELVTGTRPVGRPKKRYKDHVKDMMKRCSIDPSNLENLAADRNAWRAATKSGAAHYEAKLRERNDAARQSRHRQRDPSTDSASGLPCPRCSRTFRTAAGLAKHGRAHQRRLMEERRHRIDGLP